MGDPKRIRRKFIRPGHPWQKERIEFERQILRDYGLKNKTEIWKFNTTLKNFADQAKRLIAARGSQADREQKQLLARLAKLGLLAKDSNLDAVLSLKLENLLDRRLQTVLVKKQLANTPKQARQFITHRHVMVGQSVVTSPAHLVTVDDEALITFAPRSGLADANHPERTSRKKTEEPAAPEASATTTPAEPAPAKKKAAPRKKAAKKEESKPEADQSETDSTEAAE